MESIQKKRGTPAKSCLRCHRRKQRCVGYPACSNCTAANIPCSRSSTPTLRRLAGLSKEELLQKIEELEAGTSAQPARGSTGSPTGQDDPVDDWHANEGTLGELDDHQEPRPTPNPSTSTEVALARDSPRRMAVNLEATELSLFGEKRHAAIQNTSSALKRQTLTTFLESMHRRVTFCDFDELLRTNDLICRGLVTPTSMQLIRLYMAYAIGAMVLQLTGAPGQLHPERFFEEALAIHGSIKQHRPIDEAEFLLWQVLYKLRGSFSSDVWYLIGSAMRTAVDANLHRESHYSSLSPKTADEHRRLFWAIYLMERNICWSLKRPFSLAEDDIDTRIPTAEKHAVALLSLAYGEGGFPDFSDEKLRPLDTSVFTLGIELSRISSQIYSQIHRAGGPSTPRDHIPPLLDRLYLFEASLPPCSPPDYDFLQMHIKNTIRKLIEPALSSLHPSDYLIRTYLDAAGGVCRLFKKLRLKRCLGYSFTLINSVFVTGVTIWLPNHKSYVVSRIPSLWTPARANDLRACSSSLYAAAERNRAVKKYCDTLDAIIEAVSEHIEKASDPMDCLLGAHSNAESPGDDSSPREAFGKLGSSLKELKFEFPSDSYPSYRFDNNGAEATDGIGAWSDVTLSGSPWGSFGPMNDEDIMSMPFLFGGS
ncbi:fungal-specific transcription factor domain-containing protein [Plectosphaerella plurivora]|uniref:Fungal-specific transcription factor domain-containing protein n=1 Tax=Plectosphaerella plurivora TaxID=936078 RepID=A0A9P8V8U5_9PEZI|nr:fungal-specific transcription factor domain-containing protein [Plectosphaerella plurivora]